MVLYITIDGLSVDRWIDRSVTVSCWNSNEEPRSSPYNDGLVQHWSAASTMGLWRPVTLHTAVMINYPYTDSARAGQRSESVGPAVLAASHHRQLYQVLLFQVLSDQGSVRTPPAEDAVLASSSVPRGSVVTAPFQTAACAAGSAAAATWSARRETVAAATARLPGKLLCLATTRLPAGCCSVAVTDAFVVVCWPLHSQPASAGSEAAAEAGPAVDGQLSSADELQHAVNHHHNVTWSF